MVRTLQILAFRLSVSAFRVSSISVNIFLNFFSITKCASLRFPALLCASMRGALFEPSASPPLNQNLMLLSRHAFTGCPSKVRRTTAQGWSFLRIASELGVARSTLIEWSRQLRFQVQNQAALEFDDLQHRLLGPPQHRAAALAEKLAVVEGELKKRDLAKVTTPYLFSLAAALRRQVVQETAGIKFVAPVKDIPADEYVEQVQEWKP